MRAILLISILAVVALIAAFATGLVDISQTRDARAPSLEAATARSGPKAANPRVRGSDRLGRSRYARGQCRRAESRGKAGPNDGRGSECGGPPARGAAEKRQLIAPAGRHDSRGRSG